MKPYEYKISLRFWHPSIDPDEISGTIGIDPDITHKFGMQIHTPNGTQLKGRYPKSYWHTDLVNWNETSSVLAIEEDLTKLVDLLSSHKNYFARISNEGGQVQLWVSTHSLKNYCIQLPSKIMGNLGNIGVEVIIDVYPYPQNW